MKFKNLFMTLGLALAVGAGVGAALGNQGAQQVRADDAGVAAGTITLDLTNSRTDADYWYSAACNVAINFHQGNSWENQEWSNYVAVAKDQKIVEVTFPALTHTPTQFSIIRYDGTYTQESWTTNKWPDAEKWGQTAEVEYIGSTKYFFADYTHVDTIWIKSSATDWGFKTVLDSFKVNESSHIEYYSNAISMVADEEFGMIYNWTWYTTVTFDSSVSGKFSGGNGSNIVCSTPGTYAFYFDSVSHSLYITDPLYAAADEWAQEFLGVTGGSDTCSFTKTSWGTAAASYSALDPEVKALFEKHAYIEHTAETSTYLEKAVQRYDYVLVRFGICKSDDSEHMNNDTDGYVDFIERESKLPVNVLSYGFTNDSINNTQLTVVIIICATLAVSICGVIILRKKKQN